MPVNTVELNKISKNCIESEPPRCTGACPFNMDLRAFSAAVADGDLIEARRVFERKIPLPHVIAAICDARCKLGCLRKDFGGAVEAHLLEKMVMASASKPEPTGDEPAVFSKRQRLAVIGSGLSGLYAAATLLRKEYTVTIFDAAAVPGGRLRDRPDIAECLNRDWDAVAGAQFLHGIEVGKNVGLNDLAGEFDAVIVCWGAEAGREGLGEIDARSLQTSVPNIFAAGSLLGPEVAESPSLVAESGRRAANSAERLFQNVSLMGNRDNEGVFESRLYTNTDGVAPLPSALNPEADEACTAEQARAEAARCLQCHCLECKRRCVYLQHYNQYSGAAIRPVIKNVNISRQWGHRQATPFIASCAVCGLCGAVCPTKIDMGYVNQRARDAMWENTYLPPAMHDFPLRDMEYSLDTARLVRHQPGATTSKYALFPGCQLPASMPGTTRALYRHLTENLDGGVGLLMSCCGAPARWAARLERAEEIRKLLIADWKALGEPELLVCCPGCFKECREHLPDIPVRFIAEVLPDMLPETSAPDGVYAFHDPCLSRHFPVVQDSSRTLARALAAEVEELPVNRDETVCCSYGGLQYHVNPEVSAKTWGSRIGQSPLPYLTSCSNCRDFFRFGGKDSVHLLELLFGREEGKGSSSYACMDFSKRRVQRRELVNAMRRELWKEEVEDDAEPPLDIVFTDDMLAKIHRKDMLVQDVRSIIAEAEATGRKMRSTENNRFYATRRGGVLSYWVEYTVEDGRVLVHSCYTHRMHITLKPYQNHGK